MKKILVWKSEMKADDFRMMFHHKIAHFVVEGSSVRNRANVISLQFDVIGIQASPPAHLPGAVVPRRLVTEEVCIDGTRGASGMFSSSLRACSTVRSAQASEPRPPDSATATTMSENATPAIG